MACHQLHLQSVLELPHGCISIKHVHENFLGFGAQSLEALDVYSPHRGGIGVALRTKRGSRSVFCSTMVMQAMAAEPLVTSWLIASSQAIVTRLPVTGTTFPRWWIIRKLGPADGAWPNGLVSILRFIDIWGTLVRDIVLCSNLACTAVL